MTSNLEADIRVTVNEIKVDSIEYDINNLRIRDRLMAIYSDQLGNKYDVYVLPSTIKVGEEIIIHPFPRFDGKDRKFKFVGIVK